MSKFDIVRAWKDQEYYNSLSAEERALIPDNPAGVIELSEEDLSEIAGAKTAQQLSAGCPCPHTVNDQFTCVWNCTLLLTPLCVASLIWC